MNISGIPISNLDPKLEVENFGDLFAKMLGVSKEVAEPALEVVQKAFDASKEHWQNRACEFLYDELYTRANGAEHYVASKEKITQTEFVDKFRKHMEGALNEVEQNEN